MTKERTEELLKQSEEVITEYYKISHVRPNTPIKWYVDGLKSELHQINEDYREGLLSVNGWMVYGLRACNEILWEVADNLFIAEDSQIYFAE